jgi:hypothetical protein
MSAAAEAKWLAEEKDRDMDLSRAHEFVYVDESDDEASSDGGAGGEEGAR